jgi:hypothetical protein
MSLFTAALSNVLPLFALIFLGAILRRSSMVDESFISTSSKLVFRIALPVMVFRRLSQVEAVPTELIAGIGLFAGVTLLAVGFLWLFLRGVPGPQSSAAVQGAFRSNIAIVGLAIIEIAYGPLSLAYGAVVLAMIMPLYNLLAVMVLSHGTLAEGESPIRAGADRTYQKSADLGGGGQPGFRLAGLGYAPGGGSHSRVPVASDPAPSTHRHRSLAGFFLADAPFRTLGPGCGGKASPDPGGGSRRRLAHRYRRRSAEGPGDHRGLPHGSRQLPHGTGHGSRQPAGRGNRFGDDPGFYSEPDLLDDFPGDVAGLGLPE